MINQVLADARYLFDKAIAEKFILYGHFHVHLEATTRLVTTFGAAKDAIDTMGLKLLKKGQ